MKVFVTGATGYVGTAVIRLLLAEQHEVTGLVRSEANAAKLQQAGGQPVKGTLDDMDILARAAAEADAVIHTAFAGHDSSVSYDEAIETDCAAIKAMTDAMAGTNKAFVMTTGTGLFGDTGSEPVTEEYPIDPGHAIAARVNTERVAIQAASKGVRSSVLRLAMYVWGHGGSFFLPCNLDVAKKHGKSYYILPGTQQQSGVHVDDVARLYILAMMHAPAGTVFAAATSHNNAASAIAKAVGENVGVPVEGISLNEALKLKLYPDWVMSLYTIDNRVDSAKAETLLGWRDYVAVDMLSDIVNGSYVS